MGVSTQEVEESCAQTVPARFTGDREDAVPDENRGFPRDQGGFAPKNARSITRKARVRRPTLTGPQGFSIAVTRSAIEGSAQLG